MPTKKIEFNLGHGGTGLKEYEKIKQTKAYKEYETWAECNEKSVKGSFDKGEQIIHDWLWDCFKHLTSGVIVDVGSNDGVTNSHSLPFIEKGWKAVLIEPNPKMMEVAQNIYGHLPAVSMVQCAIHNDTESTRKLYVGHRQHLGHSTLREPKSWDDVERCFINENLTFEVPAKKLTSVLNSVDCPKEIDILHIDAEGLGIEVLQSLDLELYEVKVISIDISPEQYDPLAPSLLKFMRDNDFVYVFCEAQSVWILDEFLEGLKKEGRVKWEKRNK